MSTSPQKTDIKKTTPHINNASRTLDESDANASIRQALILAFEKHGHALIYGLLGFLIALLILLIGFWPTFLLSIFAAIGVLIGTYQDGSIQLKRLLARLLRNFR